MTGLFPLRPLQERAIEGLRQSLRSGKKRPIIQAPTGFGKTIVAAHIVAGALGKRKRIAFVVPMLNLIDQTLDRFRQNGIDLADMGVMQNDHPWRRPAAPIQVCSVQTIAARGFPDVDLVAIDECHVQFDAVRRWQAEQPEKIFIGLSATPWARGMAEHWDDLIIPTSIGELIDRGDLSKFRVYAPTHPDLEGVKIVAGDYHDGQLSERMSAPKIVADVVETWLAKADNRPTLLFAVDRAHAAVLHDQFESMGVASAYVDANTPREERTVLAGKFQAGQVKVICSIGTMTTGVDLDVRCISFCRPTKSEILFVQSIGRGLRTAPGKSDLLILDHSDTHLRLGMVTDIRHEKLKSGKAKDKAERKEKEPPSPIECPSCSCLIPVKARECPGCGFAPKRVSDVICEAGELIEMGSGRKADKSILAKGEFIAQLRGYAHERGYKAAWVSHKYLAKTGEWPNDPSVRNLPPKKPGPQVLAWIRSQNIRWAKSKSNPAVSASARADSAELASA